MCRARALRLSTGGCRRITPYAAGEPPKGRAPAYRTGNPGGGRRWGAMGLAAGPARAQVSRVCSDVLVFPAICATTGSSVSASRKPPAWAVATGARPPAGTAWPNVGHVAFWPGRSPVTRRATFTPCQRLHYRSRAVTWVEPVDPSRLADASGNRQGFPATRSAGVNSFFRIKCKIRPVRFCTIREYAN